MFYGLGKTQLLHLGEEANSFKSEDRDQQGKNGGDKN